MQGDAFRVKARESFQRMFIRRSGPYRSPVNSENVSPEHPMAPFPSNASERPAAFYSLGDSPVLGGEGSPNIGPTTTALLPPVGTDIDNPPSLWTSQGLETGRPPTRIPRLYPTREMAGVRFAAMTDSMGIPNGDMYFVPLPAIPKTTAVASRMRAGYPQLANDVLIPAVYVGGDS